MARRKSPAEWEKELRARALAYPETYEECPWGDQVTKVSNKIFMFVGSSKTHLTLTVRLPHSGATALQLPFAAPTGYGLGKAGWVTLTIPAEEDMVAPALYAWIDESYRGVAPKAVVKTLPPSGPPPPARDDAPLPKVFATVVLVTEDDLRRARAEKAWRACGIQMQDAKGDAWIVDVGRQWRNGVEMARDLLAQKRPPRVGLCGVRDAKMEREIAVMLPDSVALSRLPPGDPKFTQWLATWLRG